MKNHIADITGTKNIKTKRGGVGVKTTDALYCGGCEYYGRSTCTCDYYLNTGKRRPCPAGNGCKVRCTRKEANMAKATWDTEAGYQMFLDGCSDAVIGAAVGVAASTVNYYKRKHWIPDSSEGGVTTTRAPTITEKEDSPMSEKTTRNIDSQNPNLYEIVEAATCDLKGIRAICTANAIQSLWNWKSAYDLQRARANIEYLLKRLGEENAT